MTRINNTFLINNIEILNWTPSTTLLNTFTHQWNFYKKNILLCASLFKSTSYITITVSAYLLHVHICICILIKAMLRRNIIGNLGSYVMQSLHHYLITAYTPLKCLSVSMVSRLVERGKSSHLHNLWLWMILLPPVAIHILFCSS